MDTAKVNLLNEIFFEYFYVLNQPDKALQYAEQNNQLSNRLDFDDGKATALNNIGLVYASQDKDNMALVYYLKAINVCKKSGNNRVLAIAYANIGNLFYSQGNYSKTLEYFEEALIAAKTSGELSRAASLYGNMGIIYYQQGYYSNALENYIQSLTIRDSLDDKKGIAYTLSNIGIIHEVQGNYDLALEYYQKAYEMNLQVDDLKGIVGNLNNIAGVYFADKNFEKALHYYLKALDRVEQSDLTTQQAYTFVNIGGVYEKLDSLSIAFEYYTRIVKMKDNLSDQSIIVSALNSMGSLKIREQDYNEALNYLVQSLKLSKEIGLKENQRSNYKDLATCYYKMGNAEKAYEYHNLYIDLTDSIYTEKSQREIADMQTKYQTAKKESEIKRLTYEKELQDIKYSRDKEITKLLIIAISSGFIFVLILSLVLFNRNRLKRKANILLSEKKEEIETQQKEITDSIRYAERIQKAVMPPFQNLKRNLWNGFVFYRPKDIVSGDFYWLTKKEDKVFVAAADCTGHGVPGAFMSMLGITYLNEIVKSIESCDPAEILNVLRISVIEALRQTGKEGEAQDGMDMSFIVYNKSSGMLQYAGANNPIYIVRHAGIPKSKDQEQNIYKTEDDCNFYLLELKPDRMPIGIHRKMDQTFCKSEIQLYPGDSIYMFSDGYADQFGGEGLEKYKYSRFRTLFLSLEDKDAEEKREILNAEFERWKGLNDQVDDILVLGFSIQ